MKYGFFDGSNKEYVIERPDTPVPWINYLGVENYCGLISNTAGGYSFYKDPKLRRITRYRYNNVPVDRPGRYIYIRNNGTGDFWSPTWQPACKSPDKYECRHGLSYTRISYSYKKTDTQILYFVPLGDNCEIWRMKIKNSSERAGQFDIFAYVEFCLWEAQREMVDWDHAVTKFKNNAIYNVTQYPQRGVTGFCSYLWSSQPVVSWDGFRDSFIGKYHSETNPIAVENGCCNNVHACGWSACGALHNKIELEPGEEKSVTFILGYAENDDNENKVFDKYANPENITRAFNQLKDYWADVLSHYCVTSPDEQLNQMVNIWNQYQVCTTFNWSRTASYYEEGIGRGMGFRDSCQDTQGFVYQIPSKVRQRLIDLFSTQFSNGRVAHQYSPLTKQGFEPNEGDGRLWQASDDHLWMALAVDDYIKETGDLDFLNQPIPFSDGSASSLYEHLKRAIIYTWNQTGHYGLPKIKTVDWNDCLKINLFSDKDMAVSVMVAEQFVLSARITANLARLCNHSNDAAEILQMAQEMMDRINNHAWDGKWYVRAFDNQGVPLGSSKEKYGRIWLNSQVWAVISGVAQPDRAIQCMDSVYENLFTKYGVALFKPAYPSWDIKVGSLSTYPPGVKENGSIFCHTNPWAIIAECILGRGNRAYEYYKANLPCCANDVAEIRCAEPYIYAQTIKSDEHRDFGQASNSWLTGAASWNFKAASQYILGIQPDYDGLKIDPCIPSHFKSLSVTRKFREALINIQIENPHCLNKGVKSLLVNGNKIEGNTLPGKYSKKTVNVTANII